MKFLRIAENETLSSLGTKVGRRNVDNILNANSLNRQPQIGSQLAAIQQNFINGPSITKERKAAILNTMTTNYDIFEKAALTSEKEWKVISGTNSFISSLSIPETVSLPDSVNITGNGQYVPKAIYDKTIQSVLATGRVDAAIFNDYSTRRNSRVLDLIDAGNPIQWFNLPWGEITLYSSIGNDYIEFPCYPDEYDDGVSATYDVLPELLYQYEPWQVFRSSGPRSNTYTFLIHRDMWSGDHRDGKANQLIRFCEANCYADYRGASVHTATCTLFLAGKPHITGIITRVKTHWSGPIGLDGYPLVCEIVIDFTEISPNPLNYWYVRNMEIR